MPAKTANNKSTERAQKERGLIEALKAAWYLPEEDKAYWLENIHTFPEPMLAEAVRLISARNRQVDGYVSKALEEDTDRTLMAGLKAKVSKLKEKAFSIDESSEKGKAEDKLSKDLEDIDA